MGFTHEGTTCFDIPEILKQKYVAFNPLLKDSTEKFLIYIGDSHVYSGQCVENFNLYWGRVTDDDNKRIFYCTFKIKTGNAIKNGVFLYDKDSTGNQCGLFDEFEKTMPYSAKKENGYRWYEATNVTKIQEIAEA